MATHRCRNGHAWQGYSNLSPKFDPAKDLICPKCEAPKEAFRRSESSPVKRLHRRTPMKRTEPKRDWTDAIAKVEEEGCCRICKRTDLKLDAAHVLGREHDEPKVSRSTGEILKELYVDPDRVFPVCGPFPAGCHGDVDHNRVNYLQFLTLPEQVKAVEDAGGIEAARIRLEPVEHRQEVERSSVAA